MFWKIFTLVLMFVIAKDVAMAIVLKRAKDKAKKDCKFTHTQGSPACIKCGKEMSMCASKLQGKKVADHLFCHNDCLMLSWST